MFTRKFAGTCLALAFLVLASGQAFGQYRSRDRDRDRDRGNQPKPEPFEAEGTVQGVIPGCIQMVTNANKQIRVVVHPMARIHLMGTSSIDLLKSGMYVEFVSNLDKIGVGVDKVSQLTIYSPNPMRPSGLYPESAATVKRTDKEGTTFGQAEGPARGAAAGPVGGDPGIAPEPGAKGRRPRGRQPAGDDLGGPGGPGGPEGPEGPVGGARTPAVRLPGVCTVRGQVKAYHGSNVTVQAGRSMIRIELTDNPQIDVDVADYSLAAKGDHIKVRGRGFPSKGIVQAEMMQIDAIQPIAAAKKYSRGAKSDKTASKRGAQTKKGEAAEAEEKEEPKLAKEVDTGEPKKDPRMELNLPDEK